ncbi:DUF4349 domain-containing protein [Gemmata sp. JC717]|uniref:DUF4349 domain-containing protein n=1 Tax=Gemmata algarum TaxID=2975278 RepID=UPI0021BA6796|nr:DUF4349 domain-containing protein [Gemmata algarum]MDY3553751.1 DUF4349 domain-containing protein [Gemmata algarum]
MLARCALTWAVVAVGAGLAGGCGVPAENSPASAPKRPDGAGAAKNGAEANPATRAPMIVYTHTLAVVVSDLDAAAAEVDRLVAEHKGYVVQSEVRGDSGRNRSATYTFRIPVASDRAVRNAVLALGTPERNASEAQDVTEEFMDVEKRVKNLKEQEDKLNALLLEKRKEEKLEDIKSLMREIAQIRGEVERAQGRREYLLNRTTFATTNLSLREVKDYAPPTFGTQVGATFRTSWDAVLGFGQAAVLLAVALVPWAPLWGPVLAFALWRVRRWRAGRASRRLPRAVPAAQPG